PPQNAILFVGSSSFQKWHDVQDYFPNETVINRGFGGSELTDAIRYANEIILLRFETLFNIIRNAMPQVPIVYVSIKPSPSRKNLMPRMGKANKLINN